MANNSEAKHLLNLVDRDGLNLICDKHISRANCWPSLRTTE